MTQIQIVITFEPETGQINVAGPIENKILTYGLLDLARDAVCDLHRKNENRVQPVTIAGPLPPPPGSGGKH